MPISQRLIKVLPREEAEKEITITLERMLAAAAGFSHLWRTPNAIPQEGLNFMTITIDEQDNDYAEISLKYGQMPTFVYRQKGQSSFILSASSLSKNLLNHCSQDNYEKLEKDLVNNFKKINGRSDKRI